MRSVYIAGVSMTPVGEHWEKSLANLSARAILAALKDAGGIKPDALYVGNLLASAASNQSNLGTVIAENAGLHYIETFSAEAGEASGAAAFRLGYLAVLSGYIQSALVVGVEKYTDRVGPDVESLTAQTEDYDFEGVQGLIPVAQAGLLMQRYLDVYEAPRAAFGALPILAHRNARANPNAMFRRALSPEAYNAAPVVTDPLNMFDISPYADGAAAVLLVSDDLIEKVKGSLVRVMASESAVDTLALHDRPDPLVFSASAFSLQKAMLTAGMDWADISLFELWDAYSIYGVLAVEACGLAPRGEGWRWLQETDTSLTGKLPLLTMGGNKARGFPLGAAGVYQIAEAALQLRGQAGENQVPGALTALIQSMGGPAANVFTHILTNN
jgi:acetyl-CoA C-acetyltransferase